MYLSSLSARRGGRLLYTFILYILWSAVHTDDAQNGTHRCTRKVFTFAPGSTYSVCNPLAGDSVLPHHLCRRSSWQKQSAHASFPRLAAVDIRCEAAWLRRAMHSLAFGTAQIPSLNRREELLSSTNALQPVLPSDRTLFCVCLRA